MLEFEHIETLEEMAEKLQEKWDTTNISGEVLVKTVQAYATVCTAITQGYQHWQKVIAEDEIFLQIGRHIICKKDIVRVEIVEEDPKRIMIYTRDIEGGGDYSSYSNFIQYNYDSPEAQTFLHWLKGKTEVLKDPTTCHSCNEPIEE